MRPAAVSTQRSAAVNAPQRAYLAPPSQIKPMSHLRTETRQSQSTRRAAVKKQNQFEEYSSYAARSLKVEPNFAKR